MKKRFFVVTLFLFGVLWGAIGVSAQDAVAPCALGDALNVEYQGMVQRDWLEALITTLTTNIKDDDITNFLGTAQELRRVLARADATCRGLHFTSAKEGLQPVLGPISLPDGIWKATITTKGFVTVKAEAINGDCDDALLFNLFSDQATDGAQVIIKPSGGCEALISISNTSDPWDLIFEPVKLTGK